MMMMIRFLRRGVIRRQGFWSKVQRVNVFKCVERQSKTLRFNQQCSRFFSTSSTKHEASEQNAKSDVEVVEVDQQESERKITLHDQIPQQLHKIISVCNQVYGQCFHLGRYIQANQANQELGLQLVQYFQQNHPIYLSYLNNKAVILKMDNRLKQAAKIYQQIVPKYLQSYGGRKTISLAKVLFNSAQTKQLMQDFSGAIQDVEQAISIRKMQRQQLIGINEEIKKQIQKENTIALFALNGLKGSILKDLKQFQESRTILKQAYGSIVVEVGQSHDQSLMILNYLAMLDKAMGRYQQAERDLKKIIQTRITMRGVTHPLTIQARHNLGEVY